MYLVYFSDQIRSGQVGVLDYIYPVPTWLIYMYPLAVTTQSSQLSSVHLLPSINIINITIIIYHHYHTNKQPKMHFKLLLTVIVPILSVPAMTAAVASPGALHDIDADTDTTPVVEIIGRQLNPLYQCVSIYNQLIRLP